MHAVRVCIMILFVDLAQQVGQIVLKTEQGIEQRAVGDVKKLRGLSRADEKLIPKAMYIKGVACRKLLRAAVYLHFKRAGKNMEKLKGFNILRRRNPHGCAFQDALAHHFKAASLREQTKAADGFDAGFQRDPFGFFYIQAVHFTL